MSGNYLMDYFLWYIWCSFCLCIAKPPIVVILSYDWGPFVIVRFLRTCSLCGGLFLCCFQNTKILSKNGLKQNSGHIIENGRDDNELIGRVQIFDVQSG